MLLKYSFCLFTLILSWKVYLCQADSVTVHNAGSLCDFLSTCSSPLEADIVACLKYAASGCLYTLKRVKSGALESFSLITSCGGYSNAFYLPFCYSEAVETYGQQTSCTVSKGATLKILISESYSNICKYNVRMLDPSCVSTSSAGSSSTNALIGTLTIQPDEQFGTMTLSSSQVIASPVVVVGLESTSNDCPLPTVKNATYVDVSVAIDYTTAVKRSIAVTLKDLALAEVSINDTSCALTQDVCAALLDTRGTGHDGFSETALLECMFRMPRSCRYTLTRVVSGKSNLKCSPDHFMGLVVEGLQQNSGRFVYWASDLVEAQTLTSGTIMTTFSEAVDLGITCAFTAITGYADAMCTSITDTIPISGTTISYRETGVSMAIARPVSVANWVGFMLSDTCQSLTTSEFLLKDTTFTVTLRGLASSPSQTVKGKTMESDCENSEEILDQCMKLETTAIHSVYRCAMMLPPSCRLSFYMTMDGNTTDFGDSCVNDNGLDIHVQSQLLYLDGLPAMSEVHSQVSGDIVVHLDSVTECMPSVSVLDSTPTICGDPSAAGTELDGSDYSLTAHTSSITVNMASFWPESDGFRMTSVSGYCGSEIVAVDFDSVTFVVTISGMANTLLHDHLDFIAIRSSESIVCDLGICETASLHTRMLDIYQCLALACEECAFTTSMLINGPLETDSAPSLVTDKDIMLRSFFMEVIPSASAVSVRNLTKGKIHILVTPILVDCPYKLSVVRGLPVVCNSPTLTTGTAEIVLDETLLKGQSSITLDLSDPPLVASESGVSICGIRIESECLKPIASVEFYMMEATLEVLGSYTAVSYAASWEYGTPTPTGASPDWCGQYSCVALLEFDAVEAAACLGTVSNECQYTSQLTLTGQSNMERAEDEMGLTFSLDAMQPVVGGWLERSGIITLSFSTATRDRCAFSVVRDVGNSGSSIWDREAIVSTTLNRGAHKLDLPSNLNLTDFSSSFALRLDDNLKVSSCGTSITKVTYNVRGVLIFTGSVAASHAGAIFIKLSIYLCAIVLAST
eukprot:Blabericola_migrator_1__3151@NODE_191_length_11624_cov_142_842866_g68_i1_p1_GENE_NODE_191_length_11624_cov_142_842866_g68_i1NODE_191_length_11624_cov_142_842866_g68_i1_p1_ORF_typecomplete_len1029_score119_84_NODE_191_length_11624_cov_142_842866_g68_i123145400